MLITEKDTIFKMSFHATNHPVQMHNFVWVSTRALKLAGHSLDSQEDVAKWLNGIYQTFYGLRAACVRNEDDISYNDVLSLMQGYCQALRKEDVVQDFWVVLTHLDKIHLDSRKLKL